MSDRASSPPPAPVPIPQQKPEPADTKVHVKEESPSLPSPTATNTQHLSALSSPSRAIRRTVAQRRAYLREDPLSGEVEPHRVYCQACQRWIRLAPNSEYALANWLSHRQRCPRSPTSLPSVRRTPSKPSFSPSSRVATAERKIVLLNDPQVKAFSITHIQCGSCKTEVALEGEVDYDLTNWAEHKEKCIPKTPAPITPQGSRPRANPPPSTSSAHSQVSAGVSGRSATPVGEGSSSNSTAVAESPTAVKVGVKRGRDEETEEGERPTNRARTETYSPPEKDRRGLLGWLTQPLKEFARGFREGLGGAG